MLRFSLFRESMNISNTVVPFTVSCVAYPLCAHQSGQEMAVVDIEDAIQAPREPSADECCGSGCARCVWDVYYDKLSEYQACRNKQKIPSTAILSSQVTTSERSSRASGESTASSSYCGTVVVQFRDVEEIDDGKFTETPLPTQLGFTPLTRADVVELSLPDRDADTPLWISIHGKTVLQQVGDTALDGDCVGVLAPNSRATVEQFMRLLKLPMTESTTVTLSPSPFAPAAHFPHHLPSRRPMKVAEFLRWWVDLTSSASLQPPLIQLLARFAKDDADATLLKRLVSLPGHLFRNVIPNSTAYWDVPGLLAAFPSCRPPLARLLEVLAPMRLCPYSIANHRDANDCPIEVLVKRSRERRCIPTFVEAEGWEGDDFERLKEKTAAFLAERPQTFHGHCAQEFSALLQNVPRSDDGGLLYVAPRSWRSRTTRLAVGCSEANDFFAASGHSPLPPFVAVAGGTGFAPIRTMIQRVMARHRVCRGGVGIAAASASSLLVLCVKYQRHWHVLERMLSADWATHGGVRIVPVVTRERGAMLGTLEEAVTANQDIVACAAATGVLVCGPPGLSEKAMSIVLGDRKRTALQWTEDWSQHRGPTLSALLSPRVGH